MGVHQYFKSLSDLEKIYRCPGKFKFQEHSVAAHSFKVAKIAQFFGHVEEKAGNKVNWRALYQKALNHDYPELFTGDIKTPVKYSSKELHELFKQVEEEMTKNFINGVFPEEYRDIYFDLFKEGKDDTLEGKILSVSDKVDLLYESFGEIQKGNPEPLFLEIYEESLRTILRFSGLASVQYFLTSILPDLLAERFIERSQLRGITDEIIENEFKR
ncbi:MAG: HD domain-containing protein [Heyndrickxia faecalis]|jgi:putative hydrolase of HD superfamily|uniref:HD domain-containing protein n=1 Tax=Heyndrickxia TaxID=2837504 RepID=UPI0008F82DAA|nr:MULTISPECIES: HD domain-containing protein [Heyndrickxia]APB35486.1 hydrolase [Heyndrickxia coagulans]MED4921186.1 HD domain-containing protein [Weizmannia sp. CD-2023]QPG54289.1 HD domain-containing protein [Heyndrickxia coagulans]UXC23256.1 HD domain-containing protein [Heyndrickxia coagulans]WMM89630.1 HD domain-containing protein [Heyndrickxia coagulans]